MRILRTIAVLLIAGGQVVLQPQNASATPPDQPAYSLAIRAYRVDLRCLCERSAGDRGAFYSVLAGPQEQAAARRSGHTD